MMQESVVVVVLVPVVIPTAQRSRDVGHVEVVPAGGVVTRLQVAGRLERRRRKLYLTDFLLSSDPFISLHLPLRYTYIFLFLPGKQSE